MATKDIIDAVKERYGAIARGEKTGCGCATAEAPAIGYSSEDLRIAGDANLGLGCGNPLALAALEPGMTVLDLGSGAGFDAFLAWNRVGTTGRVIGVDMTDEMLERARQNAANLGATNVEFRKGMIEKLPVEDAAADFVISNCVINLSADKPAVFREIARVLRPGGRFAVSDIVLLKPLPREIEADVNAYVGCIAGASKLSEYVSFALAAGLSDLAIPQITPGTSLTDTLVPDDGRGMAVVAKKYGSEMLQEAARAIASVKLHGRKP